MSTEGQERRTDRSEDENSHGDTLDPILPQKSDLTFSNFKRIVRTDFKDDMDCDT